jgi:hypothetical protein
MVGLAMLNERFTRAPLEQRGGAGLAQRAACSRPAAQRRGDPRARHARRADPALDARQRRGARRQLRAAALGAAFSGLSRFSRQLIQW